MVRRAGTKARSQKASNRRRKEGLEKIGEGLQQELDAIVAPIGMEAKDLLKQRDHLAERKADEEVPKETLKHEIGEEAESRTENRDRTRREKTYSWGIVIGETD